MDEYTRLMFQAPHCHYIHEQAACPYPAARNKAAQLAKGQILVFADDHVIPESDFFVHVEADAKRCGLLHSSYCPILGDCRYYHQTLTPQMTRKDYVTVPNSETPYFIASANHGMFAVERKKWFDIGGYWSEFPGYGQDEIWLDLKVWQKGYTVMLDPKMGYWHYSVRHREYERTRSDEMQGPTLDLELIRRHMDEYRAVY